VSASSLGKERREQQIRGGNEMRTTGKSTSQRKVEETTKTKRTLRRREEMRREREREKRRTKCRK